MSTYDPQKKVYAAQGGRFSILDLLRNFADPELEVDGISRISDLHMKVGEPVRYRFDGQLETIEGGEPLSPSVLRELVYPLLSPEHRDRLDGDVRADVDVGYLWEEASINFRLNVFRDRDGLACVMRMLPKHIPDIDEIGFMNDRVWRDLVVLKQGLVIINGVTGSGKSTTLASLISYINKSRKVRIITLEDPIEYVFRSEQGLISQRELGRHVESFQSGLRSALRENPDIIYVGEIRDAATAQLALTAAETGHLVLSTLHTRDAKSTLSRIVDMFPGERANEIAAQLSFSLAYVVSQKLLARKSGDGRVPAFEVLKNNAGMANLMRTGKIHQMTGAIETSVKEGMNTLEQHLVYLVEQGIVSRQEAVAHANDGALAQRLS
jgi:twitching motility protein PilT